MHVTSTTMWKVSLWSQALFFERERRAGLGLLAESACPCVHAALPVRVAPH